MIGGVLAIWFDCVPGTEATVEDWYQTEHLDERLGLPSFRAARRFESLDGAPAHMTVYEVTTPEALASPAYLARLDDPTPRTRAVMGKMVQNMSRTVCRRRVLFGDRRGGVAVVARLKVRSGARSVAEELWDPIRLARIELWTATDSGPVSEEERLRGGDARIGACLYAEALRAADAEALAREMAERLPGAKTGTYRLLCQAERTR